MRAGYAARGGGGTTFARMTGMQEMRASVVASQLVESLDYPATKNSILTAARETNVGLTVQYALNKLPDREYVDAEDLTRELTRAS